MKKIKVKMTAEIINHAFRPCAEVAASRLYKTGVTELQLMEMRKQLLISMPEPHFLGTINALRDIERGFRKPIE